MKSVLVIGLGRVGRHIARKPVSYTHLDVYKRQLMPWLLAFAAGAMMYVVVEELIPEAHLGEHSNTGTLGVMAGFLVMMILDVAMG